MEDFSLEIVIDSGLSARSLHIPLALNADQDGQSGYAHLGRTPERTQKDLF